MPNIAMFCFCPSALLMVSSTSWTYCSRVYTNVPLYYSISGAYCSDLILAWISCMNSSLGFWSDIYPDGNIAQAVHS